MECKDILNLIAIIVIPIVAVLIGQHLQNRAEIRKDKMHIFKVLMTSRIYGWTQESVHCLIDNNHKCFSGGYNGGSFLHFICACKQQYYVLYDISKEYGKHVYMVHRHDICHNFFVSLYLFSDV